MLYKKIQQDLKETGFKMPVQLGGSLGDPLPLFLY